MHCTKSAVVGNQCKKNQNLDRLRLPIRNTFLAKHNHQCRSFQLQMCKYVKSIPQSPLHIYKCKQSSMSLNTFKWGTSTHTQVTHNNSSKKDPSHVRQHLKTCEDVLAYMSHSAAGSRKQCCSSLTVVPLHLIIMSSNSPTL